MADVGHSALNVTKSAFFVKCTHARDLTTQTFQNPIANVHSFDGIRSFSFCDFPFDYTSELLLICLSNGQIIHYAPLLLETMLHFESMVCDAFSNKQLILTIEHTYTSSTHSLDFLFIFIGMIDVIFCSRLLNKSVHFCSIIFHFFFCDF